MTFTFGRVCVDAQARRVSRDGRPVRLTRKAFDLLLLLLEHGPDAVSKEQIHARIWPHTFVGESSLQSLVHEIRRRVDDPARGASWIVTVHGVGYRFEGDAVTSRPAAGDAARPAAWLVAGATRLGLLPGENVIGRGEGVIEIDAPTISRHHARITVAPVVTIEDLGSKNGTWIDGQRVTASAVLADGTSVRLGSVTMAFQLGRQPEPTESVREPAAHVAPRRTAR